MNAHIGSSSHDYIDLDHIDDFVPLPELGLYQPDTPILRNSQELKETDMIAMGKYSYLFANHLHLESSMADVEVIVMENLHAFQLMKNINPAY